MKRKQSTEPDFYVVNKKPTEKELKELSEFIKEYKRKQSLKKKHNKVA
jgi:hypothetical protein